MNDLFSLAGRVALVTGGSRGIGRMIAAGFLAQGARVYVSSRKAEACERTAAELAAAGPCFALPADVSSLEGVNALAAAFAAREARLVDASSSARASTTWRAEASCGLLATSTKALNTWPAA